MREPYSAEQLLGEFPQAATAGGGAATAGSGNYEELAELVRQVMIAESFHDPLVRLAWRFVKDGMSAGKVVETLQGLLLAVEPHDERWQARFDEVERTVASASAKHQQLRPALDIIIEWMDRRYAPRHRNPEQNFYSAAEGADIPLSRIHADREVLDALRFAIETPRAGGRVKESQLPVIFNRFKPAAYGELLKGLPPRDDEAIVGATSVEFRRQLEAMLTSLVAGEGPNPWGHSKRALGTWCHWHASLTPGAVARFGSRHAWGLVANGFKIGLTPKLAEQLGHRELARLTSQQLAIRCRNAGILDNSRSDNRFCDGPKRFRITWLSTEFVAELELSTDHGDHVANAMMYRLRPERKAG